MVVTASLRPNMLHGARGAPRGGAGRGAPDPGTNLPVLFELLNPYKLTSLTVVEVQTNQGKAPEHILWHLVSTKPGGSDPVKVFFYGSDLPGMTPYLSGVSPEPLSAGVPYRIELEAGRIKGGTQFQTTGKPQ
jgi:hypothetical protein